ncbi:hypothetical protein DRO53_04650, partial [Candidatus Bathyarchaeota archaeon]
YYIINKGILLDLGISYNPPLVKYMIGLSQLLGGVNSFSIRLPSALMGLGVLALTYLIGRKLWSGIAGLIAAFILVNSRGFYQYAVMAYLDMGLAFFAIATVAVYVFASRPSVKYPLLGVTSGLMMCSKYTGFYLLVVVAAFTIYDAYKEGKMRYFLYFAFSFLLTVGAVLAPYLMHYEEYLGMLSMATTEYKRGATKVYVYIDWFLNDWVRYGPQFLIGLIAAIVYYVFSRNPDRRFLALACIVFFAGVSLFQRHYRFILPDLPYLALFFSGAVYEGFKWVERKLSKRQLNGGEGILTFGEELPSRNFMIKAIAIILILIVVFTPMINFSKLGRPINVDSGTDKAAQAILNYVNSREAHRTVVLTQSLPNLLYYLSADPHLYISINPRTYYTSIHLDGKVIHLYWIGQDPEIDGRALRLLKKNKVHIVIIHSLTVLQSSEFGQAFLRELAPKIGKESVYRLTGNVVRIYYIEGVMETEGEE